MRLHQRLSRDEGFTILEVVVVVVLTAILAGIFAQAIVSTMTIYNDQTLRKDMQIDVRRSYESIWHDMREWTEWVNSPTGSMIDFRRYMVQNSHNTDYWAKVRVGYQASGSNLYYKLDQDGGWNNNYPLIIGNLTNANSVYSETTLGGKRRLTTDLYLGAGGKPYKVRITAYPRIQG
jgi:prepilin-type N-terminal cleavage/methylation domain-containing protein